MGGGEFGWTQQQESKKEGYSYYYEGSFVSLTPSKSLIAIEEGVPDLSFIVKDNQLEKDPLSEKEALKNKSLGLYRTTAIKKKHAESTGLDSILAGLPRTMTGQVQPVFEQGGALLIPADEVIIGFKKKTALPDVKRFLHRYLKNQGIIKTRKHREDSFILTIENPSNGRAFEVARHLTTLDKVSFAEPNMIVVMLGEQESWNRQIKQIKETLPYEQLIVAHTGKGQNEMPFEVTAQSPPGWTTIASLNFESDDLPQNWQVSYGTGRTEAYWGATNYRKHGGSRSFYCAAQGSQGVPPPGPAPVNMDAVLRSPTMGISSYKEVYVELWFYAKNDLATNPYGYLELFDYPSIWVFNANSNTGTGQKLGISYDGNCTKDPTTSNGWRRFLYRVPPSYRTADVFFDFRYSSDGTDQYEGAYIDDIRIVGTSKVDTEPISNDTYSARQYELKNVGQVAGLVQNRNDMHVPEAWDLISVSQDIVVAVIDDGVELNHPDLNLVTGYDFDGAEGGHPRDPHGTNCAGNVGAIKDNGIGVVGAAPGVKIMPVYYGETYADSAMAIDVAVASGAHILSNSWGWVGAPSQDIKNAIMAALSAGKIVLFAAGNGPDRSPYTYDVAFPGNLTGTTDVICVGASSPTDEHKNASSSDGKHYWGSSYEGDGPDVVAPGPWSYTTDLMGTKGYNDGSGIDPNDSTSADYSPDFGGTSSSTPKVAGIVALMLSKNPNLTPSQVKTILRNSADDIDSAGIDDKTGAGRVNAYAAVSAVTVSNSLNVTYFKINNDAASTTSQTVKLNNTATGDPTEYMASESPSFTGATWQTYLTESNFTLSAGNGNKTVYFKVKNASGESTKVSDSIVLAVTNPTPTPSPTPDLNSWIITTVDSTGDVGLHTSLTLDDQSHAHISYSDYTNRDLKYATNALGTWVTTTVDSTGDVGRFTSLALENNGKGHISYCDYTNRDLKYATNASGTWVTTTVDSTGDVGRLTSLALDNNGKVHISYWDYTNRDLKYATNASGTWVTTTVDSTGDVGRFTSLALENNGKVHISYCDNTNRGLKYATNASGIWVTTTVDSNVEVSETASLALDDNGNVHIIYDDYYYDEVNEVDYTRLKYITNASGNWVATRVDNNEYISGRASLALDDYSNAHICYGAYDPDDGMLRLRHATNASGTWIRITVDRTGDYTSLALDNNGNAHISYYDSTNDDLKYATNASGVTAPSVTSFSINNGDSSTTSPTVKLNNTATGDPTEYMASESPSFAGATWQIYLTEPNFTLSAGNGNKTVYFKVKNASGESPKVSDSIALSVANPTPTPSPSPSPTPTPGDCTDAYEQNDDFSAAYGPLTSGNSYSGKICSPADMDYFQITTSGAGMITINLNVPSGKDYDLVLYDASQALIDISGNGGSEPESIQYDASTPGTYYIKVFGYGGAFDETQTYTLSGTWPSTLPPKVTSLSVNSGEARTTNRRVTLHNTATGNPTAYLASESPDFTGARWQDYSAEPPRFVLSKGSGLKTVYFKVKNDSDVHSKVASDSILFNKETDCIDDYEPNDDFSAAFGPLVSGNSYSGKMCSPADNDYFQISVSNPGTISLNLSVPSDKDYDLELYNSSYQLVDFSENLAGESEGIQYQVLKQGIYYISVYGYDGEYDETQTYTLSGTWPSKQRSLDAGSGMTTDDSSGGGSDGTIHDVKAVVSPASLKVNRDIDSAQVSHSTGTPLKYFRAKAGRYGRVALQWETSAEAETAGFNLYRSRSRNGGYTKVNNVLITTGYADRSGVRYRFADEPDSGKPCYYKLEHVGNYGESTMYSPIKMRRKSPGNE